MARRFLFSSTSGYGHVHPLIPLARALQNAGHVVAFAGREFVRLRIETLGLEFFAVGSDPRADTGYQQFRREREAMPTGFDLERFIYTRLFCGIMPRLMTPGLVDVARTWKPDVMIREGGEYGSVIAAEHAGIPHATVAFTTALQGMNVFEQNAAKELDAIRAQWNLTPDPELESLYHYLYLSFCPPSFALHDVGMQAPQKIPATVHFIRPQFFDAPESETLPGWVTQLPAQPIVYVTLGTEVNSEPELYPRVMQNIITGLRDLPINLIVTLGRDKDPNDFGAQPGNVRIEKYIPQSLLLPLCDLMVMHGGSNSLLQAIAFGLPLVIIPLIADQFFNAHVAQEIKWAQVVTLDALSPETIRAVVPRVLADSRYRETAARLSGEMRALPDLHHAVALLEQLAHTRQPVPGAARFNQT